MKNKASIIFLFGIFLCLIEFTSAMPNNFSVFGGIEDVYTFDSKGGFERKSITWLTHNDKEVRKDLVFSQPFPYYKDESHQFVSNIYYDLYWDWDFNGSRNRTPEKDFSLGETIVDINALEYGHRAHIERIYQGKFKNNNINLGLKFELLSENSKCEEMECGDYNYQYFKRVIKLEKSIRLGLGELYIKNLITNPDKIYDEGDYRVLVWESFTLDTGELKFQDIQFNYGYNLPSWLAWTIMLSIIFSIIGFLVNKYYYHKKPSKQLKKLFEFLKNPAQVEGVSKKASKGIIKFFE